MLTRADLEAIRRIVREEVERAQLPCTASSGAPRVDGTASSESDEAMRDFASATVAHMRQQPGSEERLIRAEARYRLRGDETWRRDARRHLRLPDEHQPTEDEMLRFARYRRKRNKETAAKSKATRERKRLAKQQVDEGT